MTDQSEQIQIKSILAGDTQAFTLLVNSHKDRAVLVAYNILLNQEDAEEVAQDSFVKAFLALSTFKADSRFSTWLHRIVVNTALNKRKLKRHCSENIPDTFTNEMPYAVNNILASLITGEHRKHIQYALKSMNTNERLCITLFYLAELSIAEIHELTNISAAGIKTHLFRGRKNLYVSLHKHLKNEIVNLI